MQLPDHSLRSRMAAPTSFIRLGPTAQPSGWAHLPLLSLGVSTLALVLWTWLVMWQMPDDGGIFASRDGRIVALEADGIAYIAGMRVGDHLVAIDGVRLENVKSLYWGAKPGDTIVYSLERGGRRLDVHLTLRTPPLQERLLRLEQVLVAISFFVVSMSTWALWPSDRASRRFYVLSQVLASALVLELLDSLRWPYTGLLCGVLTVFLAPLALHFYSVFPGTIPEHRKSRILRMAYVVALVLAVWTAADTYASGGWIVSQWLALVRRLYIVAILIVAVALLIKRLLEAPNRDWGGRGLVIAGMLASVLPLLLLSFLPQLLRGSPLMSYSWTIPAIILLPASYAYASLGTLRKRLAEVEQVRDELAETRHRLVEQREAERTRLSRELHDGPLQELLWLQTQLRRLERKLSNQPTSPQPEELRAQLQETISELRSIGLDLRPPILTEHGLRAALEWHASMIQRKYPGVRVLSELTDDGQRLPETQRVALFRIYQEAVQNAAKHAQATCVGVRFTLDDESAMLEISDDGRGFQVPQRLGELVWTGHLGLVGMAERVEALGGRLEVSSTFGGGTTVRVIAPVFPDIGGQTGGKPTYGRGNQQRRDTGGARG